MENEYFSSGTGQMAPDERSLPAVTHQSTPSSSSGDVKNMIADKLRMAADMVSKRADKGLEPEMADYERQVSTWLNKSADYVSDFELERANNSARKYVKDNPGQGLLIAGALGLIVGAILRRR